jgi:hypothetical protein
MNPAAEVIARLTPRSFDHGRAAAVGLARPGRSSARVHRQDHMGLRPEEVYAFVRTEPDALPGMRGDRWSVPSTWLPVSAIPLRAGPGQLSEMPVMISARP